MPCCAAWGCHNRLETDKNFSYHHFPDKIKKTKPLKKWLQNNERTDDFKVSKYTVLCSAHFEPHMFQRNLKAEIQNNVPKRMLKEDAVPTLFVHRKEIKIRASCHNRIIKREKKRFTLLCTHLIIQVDSFNLIISYHYFGNSLYHNIIFLVTLFSYVGLLINL